MELRQGKISTNIQNQSLLDELEEIVAQWQTMSSNLSGYLTSKNE
jgi:CHASE3 domain sensor protein